MKIKNLAFRKKTLAFQLKRIKEVQKIFLSPIQTHISVFKGLSNEIEADLKLPQLDIIGIVLLFSLYFLKNI
jgi:hypothetical protein